MSGTFRKERLSYRDYKRTQRNTSHSRKENG